MGQGPRFGGKGKGMHPKKVKFGELNFAWFFPVFSTKKPQNQP